MVRPFLRRPDAWPCRRLALMAFLALLASCHIVPTSSNQTGDTRSGNSFDSSAFVARIWSGKVVPTLESRSVSLVELVAALRRNPELAGQHFGRRSREGSFWTFATSGVGTVESIDAASRSGRIVVRTQSGSIAIQTGPVVEGTALRDALPFLNFNSFPNQIAFADVNSALTRRALSDLGPSLRKLRVGERIRFAGVFAWDGTNEAPLVTPYRLAKETAA